MCTRKEKNFREEHLLRKINDQQGLVLTTALLSLLTSISVSLADTRMLSSNEKAMSRIHDVHENWRIVELILSML